jgi:predicted N-acetyltransferase YhbS
VRRGLVSLRERGCPFVVVVGHPEYYPRFGFEPASKHGLMSQGRASQTRCSWSWCWTHTPWQERLVWQGTETNSTKSHKRRPNTRMEPTRLWLMKPRGSFVTLVF